MIKSYKGIKHHIVLCIDIALCNTSFILSQISQMNILVDWSLSGIMTLKLAIRESESPRPMASSILISRMTSSSVIIPYRISTQWRVDIKITSKV